MDEIERFIASQTDNGRYRLLVNAIKDYAIYMLDADGVVTSWNAGAEKLKGYSEAEAVGLHLSRFYEAADRQAGVPQLALHTAARTGKFMAEGWRVRKDGSRFWAEVQIDPIWSPHAELVGFAKVTRDLSEREAARASLAQSEEQFRLLVQSVTDYAIFMLDAKGRVSNWNAGAQRIKGYTPIEIIGQHFSKFYTPADIDSGEPQRALTTAIRKGHYEQEGWRVRKDGSEFWASVVIDPIFNDDGSVLGFAKVTRDISERRQAQRALQQTRQQLFQTQKMESLGQLTGGVAHDFNNLLTAILGSLELVRKRVDDDPGLTQNLDVAIWAAERAAMLTARMLAFARRQELTITAVDLPDLVEAMDGLIQRSLGPAVQLETRLPTGLKAVLADGHQIELAVLNLLINARDAMPAGGVVTIEARQARMSGGPAGASDDDYICLSVSDTGEGMDAQTLARAAEPFFTTKGPGNGSGLGLSMVHGLAEQLGGRMIINSSKGVGTTVELWLPAVKAVAAAAGDSELPLVAMAAVAPLSIVVVDDDALVLMSTSSLLQDLGHRVFEATSGPEALAIISREKSVGLVITDYSMPQMDGFALAKAIYSNWPKLPIIVATGYATLPAIAELACPKLHKPYRQDELERAIALAIDGDRGQTRAPVLVN